MSVERTQKSYYRLGIGTENLTLLFDRHPDRVLKFARKLYIWRKYLLDKNGYNSTKDRIKKNLEIINQHVNEKFLPKTVVKSFGNIWWTQQEKLPVSDHISSENIAENPQLIPQIINIIEQAEAMHKETGYYIDWFGFNRIDEIIKLLTLPDYWSIPNLIISNNQQLKIFDLGLYLDNNAIKDKKDLTVSPMVDAFVCKLQLYLIGKVRKKIGLQLTFLKNKKR